MTKIDVTAKLSRHPYYFKHKDENATPYNDAHALVIKINAYEVDVIFEGTDKYYTFIPQTNGWVRKALDEVANHTMENGTLKSFETAWEALPFEESR